MKDQSLISSLLGERNSFVLIGLTGRTGSGCTTTADLLKKNYRYLWLMKLIIRVISTLKIWIGKGTELSESMQ